jgi:hypothetical protein
MDENEKKLIDMLNDVNKEQRLHLEIKHLKHENERLKQGYRDLAEKLLDKGLISLDYYDEILRIL